MELIIPSSNKLVIINEGNTGKVIFNDAVEPDLNSELIVI